MAGSYPQLTNNTITQAQRIRLAQLIAYVFNCEPIDLDLIYMDEDVTVYAHDTNLVLRSYSWPQVSRILGVK